MKMIEILKRSFAVLLLSFMAIGMMSACSSSEESSGSSSGTNCDQALTSEERQKCLDAMDDAL